MLERQLTLVRSAPLEQPCTQVRVAFATTDLKHVDQHFGWSRRFIHYDVSTEHFNCLGVGSFHDIKQYPDEDKLQAKLEWLSGCNLVFCVAIGSSAIQQLLQRGVQPIRVDHGTLVRGVLRRVQTELERGTAPWIRHALRSPEPSRIDELAAMTQEEWIE